MRLLVAPIIVAIGFACGCALPDFGGSDAAAPGPVERAQARAARLSDSELVGQRLVAGFAGESIPDDLRRSIGDGLLGGVVLFDENFDGQAGARRLIAELQSIPRPRGLIAPLLVMLDQEGGLVRRLPGPPAASAERMGAGGTPECRRQGAETAAMLKRAGVNVDLAPVLDVARAGGALDLEQRSFGRDPDTVASCAGAFAAALERGGVAPTAKHFPGLGAARVNTDDAVQRIDLGRSTLRGIDERPYRGFAGAGSGGRLVMLSSAVYPAFSELPAALSRRARLGRAQGPARLRRAVDHGRARNGVDRSRRRFDRGGETRRQGGHRPDAVHRPRRRPAGRKAAAGDASQQRGHAPGVRRVRGPGVGASRAAPRAGLMAARKPRRDRQAPRRIYPEAGPSSSSARRRSSERRASRAPGAAESTAPAALPSAPPGSANSFS